ncbi:hypothetical protein MRX96_049969 [Rhipicephalus microplus]
MAREDPRTSPSARIINRVDSATKLMSSQARPSDDAGGESHHPTPQTENPGELTLSGPISDTSMLAEHTQQIRQLLMKRATAERWDDFLIISEEAISVVRNEAKIADNPAGGKSRIRTNPNNAQQIKGFYCDNHRRAVSCHHAGRDETM